MPWNCRLYSVPELFSAAPALSLDDVPSLLTKSNYSELAQVPDHVLVSCCIYVWYLGQPTFQYSCSISHNDCWLPESCYPTSLPLRLSFWVFKERNHTIFFFLALFLKFLPDFALLLSVLNIFTLIFTMFHHKFDWPWVQDLNYWPVTSGIF